jgi:hypothetical protein
MRLRLATVGMVLLALAACARATPGALNTATPVLPTVALDNTAAPTEAAPSATPAAPAGTDTPAAAEATLEATEMAGALDTVLSDPVLQTYRVMLAMQVNAQFLADTVQATAAGTLEGDDAPVAALLFGTLTQSVDEDAAGVTPPPELTSAWQAALAAHEGVKALSGQWLLSEVSTAEMVTQLGSLQSNLEAALTDADTVVAATYHVQAASLTHYRERLRTAMETLFE